MAKPPLHPEVISKTGFRGDALAVVVNLMDLEMAYTNEMGASPKKASELATHVYQCLQDKAAPALDTLIREAFDSFPKSQTNQPLFQWDFTAVNRKGGNDD